MLRGTFEDAGDMSPTELRSAYDDRLVETVDAVGVETVTAETGVERETLTALQDGSSPELTLDDAVAILGTDEELPGSESLLAEARDILLMGMSMAVLDVEAVSAGIEGAMEPREIQQKAEGRHRMGLDEYALLHSYIEGEKR